MSKQPLDADMLRELERLGAEGNLWSIDVIYDVGNGETKHHWRRNMTGRKTMDFRKRMFLFGFEIMTRPGEWEIICPIDIRKVYMYRQTRYIPEGAAVLDPKRDQPSG